MRTIDHLYHLAETENLHSILEHGLMSTSALLALAGMPEADRALFLSTHRPTGIRLAPTILVRDQKPMPPNALAGALDDGMAPGDWYALLNSFVFLWPDFARLERQRAACNGRPQTLLSFDLAAILERFGDDVLVSSINSGNARRKPARRGRSTFIPYRTWQRDGWPTGQRSRLPAELVIRGTIPLVAPFLIEKTEI